MFNLQSVHSGLRFQGVGTGVACFTEKRAVRRLKPPLGKVCASDSLFSLQNRAVGARLAKIGENLKTLLNVLFETPKMAVIYFSTYRNLTDA